MTRFTESQADRDRASASAAPDQVDAAALSAALEDGWLILTPALGDCTLIEWQHECERRGTPFAVVRLEPTRASLWFLLTTDREWTQAEQKRVLAALATTIGYVITSNNVRAFARLGTEREVMQRLLAADGGIH